LFTLHFTAKVTFRYLRNDELPIVSVIGLFLHGDSRGGHYFM